MIVEEHGMSKNMKDGFEGTGTRDPELRAVIDHIPPPSDVERTKGAGKDKTSNHPPAATLTREEERAQKKPGWERDANDLLILERLAQKNATPEIPVTPASQSRQAEIKTARNTPAFQRTAEQKVLLGEVDGAVAKIEPPTIEPTPGERTGGNAYKTQLEIMDERIKAEEEAQIEALRQRAKTETLNEEDQRRLDEAELNRIQNIQGAFRTAEDNAFLASHQREIEEQAKADAEAMKVKDQERFSYLHQMEATESISEEEKAEMLALDAKLHPPTVQGNEVSAAGENNHQQDLDVARGTPGFQRSAEQRLLIAQFGEQPENPTAINPEPLPVDTAIPEEATPNNIDLVMEKVRSGGVLTDDDKRILSEDNASFEPTAIDPPKNYDQLGQLPDSEFVKYMSGLSADQQTDLLDGLSEEQFNTIYDRLFRLATDEEPPVPEDVISPFSDENASESPEIDNHLPEVPGGLDDDLAADQIGGGDDPFVSPPIAPTPTPIPTPTLVPTTSPEVVPATTAVIPEIIPAPVGFTEKLKQRAKDLADGLRDKIDQYRGDPRQIVRDAGSLLKEGVHSWWDGVMPVDWFHGHEPNYLKRWQFANLLFYYGGVAGGTVIDLVSLFPGLGLLRPAIRAAIGVAAPIAMGRSERAKLAGIDDSSLSDEEKSRRKAEVQERYGKANKFILNTAHGIAAGMVASTLIRGAEGLIGNLFKPKAVPQVPIHESLSGNLQPPIHESLSGNLQPPIHESLSGNLQPPEATFKVVDYHGFWKPEGLDSLGDAAKNWGISAAQGSDKQAILGLVLRQNAHHFGAIGDTLHLSDLGPNSQALIDLLAKSNTQADFLRNGGQQLINLISKGQT